MKIKMVHTDYLMDLLSSQSQSEDLQFFHVFSMSQIYFFVSCFVFKSPDP